MRDWWRIFRANWGGFVVGMILSAGVNMLPAMVAQALYMTIALCILVPFLMTAISAYLMVVAFSLFAQAYSEAQDKLATQPIQANPAEPSPA